MISLKLSEAILPQVLSELTESTLCVSTESKLGEGHFGEVYDGKASVAVKKPKDPKTESDFRIELKLLPLLRHPNIVAYVGTTAGALVMERMDKNLYQYIKENDHRLGINSIMVFGLGVAQGLEYLHQRHVLHRDIKTKNILVNFKPEIAKLSDFGQAKVFVQDNMEYEVLHYDGQLYDLTSFYTQSFKVRLSSVFIYSFFFVFCFVFFARRFNYKFGIGRGGGGGWGLQRPLMLPLFGFP